MKSLKLILASLAMSIIFNAQSQGSGKVTLKAEIESNNQDKELQISILDFTTKTLVQRDYASKHYTCNLALNQKYLLHFKKEGSPALRMVVETTAPDQFNYFILFKLNLNVNDVAAEQGISQTLGTLSFNENIRSFELKSDNELAASFCKIQHVAELDLIAKF